MSSRRCVTRLVTTSASTRQAFANSGSDGFTPRRVKGASLLLARTKQPSDRLATAKDLDYLLWRYGPFEEYRAMRADAGAGCAGMVIFRPRRHGSFWVSHVCELLVEQN